MKYAYFFSLLTALSSATGSLLAAEPAADADGGGKLTAEELGISAAKPSLPWMSGLDDGLRKAVESGRPVLVRVGGESCPWCKKLEEELPKPEVQKELAEWVLVQVDAENSPEEVGG